MSSLVHWVHTCSGDSELETEQDSAKALAGERVGMTIARLRFKKYTQRMCGRGRTQQEHPWTCARLQVRVLLYVEVRVERGGRRVDDTQFCDV